MTIVLPVALLMSLTAGEIITLYAGKAYLPAAPLFTVLVWTLIPQFAGPVLYRTILAAGQQRFLSWTSAAMLLVRVGLYRLLLPRLGIIGAAFAVWAMHSIGFGIFGAIKATRTYVIDWLRSMLRPGIALLITAALLAIIRPAWLAAWVGGLVTYTLSLLLLRSVDRSDVERIQRLLKTSGLR